MREASQGSERELGVRHIHWCTSFQPPVQTEAVFSFQGDSISFESWLELNAILNGQGLPPGAKIDLAPGERVHPLGPLWEDEITARAQFSNYAPGPIAWRGLKEWITFYHNCHAWGSWGQRSRSPCFIKTRFRDTQMHSRKQLLKKPTERPPGVLLFPSNSHRP